ncbi:hypothetical protein ACQKWADRAFT_147367 [Trichoderma austrokoningii]
MAEIIFHQGNESMTNRLWQAFSALYYVIGGCMRGCMRVRMVHSKTRCYTVTHFFLLYTSSINISVYIKYKFFACRLPLESG